MILLLVAALMAAPAKKKPVKPVELQRTDTERAGSPPFDLAPSEVRQADVDRCVVEETLPMGSGTAQKLSCGGTLTGEAVQRRCKDADKRDQLPKGVTLKTCPAEYAAGRFLFRGELKEIIVARRRDGRVVAAFQIDEGDLTATFQPVGDAVLVGITAGDRVQYAVVSSAGILRAPPLGDEAVEVEANRGRVRVIGKARAMQVDLIPHNGKLEVERH